MTMIEVKIKDDLIHGESSQDLALKLQESLIMRRYLDAEISIGKLAELMEMPVDKAMDWLHNKGIATSRMLDPELEAGRKQHRERLVELLSLHRRT